MIKSTKTRVVNKQEILKRLSTGLSEEEVQRVLAGALTSLDESGVDRLLKQVGPETSAALRRVLDADNSKRPPVPGKAKVKEEWERAWEDWDARIAEACDSEGEYVIREQPTFSVLRERLFTQWRELVAEKSVGHFLYEGYGSTKKPHWVHALADAVWEGEGSQASFCASLRQWLKAA